MLAADHTRTSDVIANSQSSRDLSLPPFDHDNEAKASMKKSIRPGKGDLETVQEVTEDLDYQIDTSIMERILPHFSSAEDEDADDDMSIEIGRGSKIFTKVEDSRDTMMSFDDSQIIISPAKSRSPMPLQSRTNRKPSVSKENLRKDAAIRRASLAVKEKDVSGSKPRAALKNQRQTLTDAHEKIRDSYDGPHNNEERPKARNAASKMTRFNQKQWPNQIVNVREAVAHAAQGGGNRNGSAKENKSGSNHTNTITDTQTRLSFALPDVDNLSELVSGMVESLPRQSSKSRTTRFTSQPSKLQQYASLDGVPIPDDEKQLFASLRHLQEQVASLKADKARLQELEQENAALRSTKVHENTDDDRKPTYVSSDDNSNGQRPAKAAIERQRLEAANIALQGHLEQANNKITSLEEALQKAEQEKESALSQRGAAYFASRELKLHNEELARENDALQAKVDMLTELLKAGGSMGRENDATGRASLNQAAGKNQTFVDEATTTVDNNAPGEQEETEASQRRSAKEMRRRLRSRPSLPTHTTSEEFAELFSLEIPFREQRPRAERQRPRVLEDERVSKKTDKAKPASKRVEVSTKPAGHARSAVNEETQGDLTFLRFINARDVERLRKTLEEEKLMQRNQLLQREPSVHGIERELTTAGGLQQEKSDVTRTGALVDENGQQAQAGKPGQPASAGTCRCAGDTEGNTPENAAQCGATLNDTMKIPKPVPVSDRMPDAVVPAHGDPTQRPAQPPALALATVLKNLEDEVNRLKAQLGVKQDALKNHDASLGKKHRKSLMKTIEVLLQDIDVKSDQIYALYDVLEGQKAAGAEMTDEEAEITMRDIVGGRGDVVCRP